MTRTVLRALDGGGVDHDGTAWLSTASPIERALLRDLDGPVLDIGCGPGRHVVALAESGIPAMGIDVTPAMLDLARSRGAPVLSRSVFDRVPGAGRWAAALLLDGNLGIGGDPEALLRRVIALLHPEGVVLVEACEGGTSSRRRTVRLEHGPDAGPAFPWIDVTIDEIPDLAARTGATVVSVDRDGGRHFVRLEAGRRS